jgi:hypothetical protein
MATCDFFFILQNMATFAFFFFQKSLRIIRIGFSFVATNTMAKAEQEETKQ